MSSDHDFKSLSWSAYISVTYTFLSPTVVNMSLKWRNDILITFVLLSLLSSICQVSIDVNLSLMAMTIIVIFPKAWVLLGLHHLIFKTTLLRMVLLYRKSKPSGSQIIWIWGSNSATANLWYDFEQVMSCFWSSHPELHEERIGLVEHFLKYVPWNTSPAGVLHQKEFYSQINWRDSI